MNSWVVSQPRLPFLFIYSSPLESSAVLLPLFRKVLPSGRLDLQVLVWDLDFPSAGPFVTDTSKPV